MEKAAGWVDPFPAPDFLITNLIGGLAQLGEHLLCKQGVVGSIPSSSTKNSEHWLLRVQQALFWLLKSDMLSVSIFNKQKKQSQICSKEFG